MEKNLKRIERAQKFFDEVQKKVGEISGLKVRRTEDELSFKKDGASTMVMCVAVDMDAIIVYGFYDEVMPAIQKGMRRVKKYKGLIAI